MEEDFDAAAVSFGGATVNHVSAAACLYMGFARGGNHGLLGFVNAIITSTFLSPRAYSLY